MPSRLRSSLRVRLAAWNAVVVLLTALVTLIGLRQGVRWALLHEMDQVLQEDIQEISLNTEQVSGDDFGVLEEYLNRKAAGHIQHGWYVRLIDQSGHVLLASAGAPDREDGPPLNIGATPQTSGRFRVAQHPARGHEAIRIQVGATLESVNNDLARIDRFVMLAVAVVLIVAPLLGYWLASRAARTVGEIIGAAARLRPDHIDDRLPVRGTGDELDQLARTINGLLDRIAAYLAEKRDFLANAAHELRSPLAAIRSSVEVALNEDRTRTEYQDLLIEIIDQGAALETLVNQLLLISESEAEQLKRDHETVAFDEVVRRSAEMFGGVADARGIRLNVQIAGNIHVSGSSHLLRQLVNNLIDNGIKYTPNDGRVDVTLAADAQREMAVLTVADTGIGISEQDVPKVFDRFYRADTSRTRMAESSGTGLGLSICQAVVAAHGGQIVCTSRPEQGTRFITTLPLVANVVEADVPATV
ncbi:MAG: HAMP domain-containing histidine kinase [Planctomycetaceae bacterium]|nr:HAMP domain-containing histidine kinase [Planctomycetaceae bacterium]